MSRAEMAMDWFGNNIFGGLKFYVGSGVDLLGFWLLGIGAVAILYAYWFSYEAVTSSGIESMKAQDDSVITGFWQGVGVTLAVAWLVGYFFGPIR